MFMITINSAESSLQSVRRIIDYLADGLRWLKQRKRRTQKRSQRFNVHIEQNPIQR